jgi:hypothetical protein
MDPRTRAAHTDRQQVADALATHTAAGRLTLDEYDQRVTATWAATTLADLGAVTADLPTTTHDRDSHRPPVNTTLLAVGLALFTVIAFGVFVALGTWAHTTGMAGMMSSMGH